MNFSRADNQIMIGFKASCLAITFGRHTRWQIDNEIKPLFGQGGRTMVVTVPDVLSTIQRSIRTRRYWMPFVQIIWAVTERDEVFIPVLEREPFE